MSRCETDPEQPGYIVRVFNSQQGEAVALKSDFWNLPTVRNAASGSRSRLSIHARAGFGRCGMRQVFRNEVGARFRGDAAQDGDGADHGNLLGGMTRGHES